MDKYRLRRAILDAALDLEPAPVTVDDLERYPLLRMAAVPRQTVAAEAANLADHGYLRNLRPTREPAYRLTPQGRDQITQDAELQEFVWGEIAL